MSAPKQQTTKEIIIILKKWDEQHCNIGDKQTKAGGRGESGPTYIVEINSVEKTCVDSSSEFDSVPPVRNTAAPSFGFFGCFGLDGFLVELRDPAGLGLSCSRFLLLSAVENTASSSSLLFLSASCSITSSSSPSSSSFSSSLSPLPSAAAAAFAASAAALRERDVPREELLSDLGQVTGSG